jgi:pilus assembly protein CpaE
MNNPSGIFAAVVVTICTGSDVTESLEKAVEKRPWLTTLSHLDAYISASRRPSFSPQVKAAGVCLAFIDFDRLPEHAAETTQYLTQIFPGKVTVIAVAAQPNPATILAAMRAGCSEFLTTPIDEPTLKALMDRLEQLWAHSTNSVNQLGSVLSLFGAKGGVGTTTLAVHLAMYLASCHKKRTLLIDQQPELGHACVYLGIDGSNYLFHEVVRNVNRLDSELLKGFVLRHSSGLEVLSSSDISGGAKLIDGESVRKTIEFLRTEYEYVIIDGDISQEKVNRPIIDASSIIYLVGTPEVGAIRDLSRHIDSFMLIEEFSEKLQVVINRSTSPYAIQIEQIERAMKLPITIRIPNAYPELVRSSNLGKPIDPNNTMEFSSQFIKWADSLVGSPSRSAAVKKERRFFAQWRYSAVAQ